MDTKLCLLFDLFPIFHSEIRFIIYVFWINFFFWLNFFLLLLFDFLKIPLRLMNTKFQLRPLNFFIKTLYLFVKQFCSYLFIDLDSCNFHLYFSNFFFVLFGIIFSTFLWLLLKFFLSTFEFSYFTVFLYVLLVPFEEFFINLSSLLFLTFHILQKLISILNIFCDLFRIISFIFIDFAELDQS